MDPIESHTLRLEPLAVAHAGEMFETLSAQSIYDYMPGVPPSSAAALRERYAMLERKSADGGQLWLNWIIRVRSGKCVGFVQATVYQDALETWRSSWPRNSGAAVWHLKRARLRSRRSCVISASPDFCDGGSGKRPLDSAVDAARFRRNRAFQLSAWRRGAG